MAYSKKLVPPVIAAAVAMIALTLFAIVVILSDNVGSRQELFHTIWPIALTSGVAVVLVMSFLYQSLRELVQELEQREELSRHAAAHDPLTGLANRRLLNDRLSQALALVRRGDLSVAVLMLDLDRFKQVNDALGHGAGDALVTEVAERLNALVRETDTVARVGGDEFVIIQSGAKSHGDVSRLCTRIIEAVAVPFALPEKLAHVGVSIGAVLANRKDADAADLIRKADLTMYRAKAAGRNCFRLFSDELDAAILRRDQIETALRRALQEEGALDLHYQPLINAAREIAGVEALLRWKHETLGEISPSEVIPIAEECGLMGQVAETSFRTACETAKRWPQLYMAVNVSPVVFRQPGLPARLREIAAKAGIPCERFELEIVESLLLEHSEISEDALQELRSSGFKISLDDFGTGYSSLGYLRRFRVDKVKLDRSLLQAGETGETMALLKGAVTLGHALGLEVVAEGIETREHEQLALAAGCDGLQGYYYAPALSADALDQLLLKRKNRKFAVAA